MGIGPFAAAKLPTGTHAKMPKNVAGSTSSDLSTKLPKGKDSAATIKPGTKLPMTTNAKLPKQRLSAAERLRRLEEAMAFLRQHLAAGRQPVRTLLKAAKTAGIAERTLHRAKDLLGVTTERSGGYAGHGQWVWFPPAVHRSSVTTDAHETGTPVSERR